MSLLLLRNSSSSVRQFKSLKAQRLINLIESNVSKSLIVNQNRSYSIKPSRLTAISSQKQLKLSNLKFQINQQQIRFGSSGALTRDDIQRRILEVLGNFEKCETTKITPTASFTADLGLDSLDAVEVVMAIEEEFSIEIPDEEADKITTVSEAIAYIERTPEAI